MDKLDKLQIEIMFLEEQVHNLEIKNERLLEQNAKLIKENNKLKVLK